MQENLNNLSTRKGFNTSLKHFKFVNKIIKKVEQKENLADLVNSALEDKIVLQYQFAPILNALLIDKFGYYSESINMKSTNSNLSKLSQEIGTWDKFDIILSYFHPQLDQTLINPKSKESWEGVDQLKENELLVIYIGNYNNDYDLDMAKKATKAIKQLVNGEKPANTKMFKDGETESTTPNENPKKNEIKKTELI